MTLTRHLIAALVCAPVIASAQTANDDMVSTELWWDRVGAGFFSDAGLETPRPEFEIRAHWTGLSADDQAAVRARCAGDENAAVPSRQEGDEDEPPAATAQNRIDQPSVLPGSAGAPPQTTNPETTTSGSVEGQEIQTPSTSDQPTAYTGLAGSVSEEDARMVMICDLVAQL